jgi:RNA polymerase sigma factor (TIGR02999 family)
MFWQYGRTCGPETNWMRDQPAKVNDVFQMLYRELHAMAHQQLRRGGSAPVLDTTVLLHEAYVRLAAADTPIVADGRHFLAYAANTMRSVVVDIVRAQRAEKRGAGATPLTLNTGVANSLPATDADVLRIHEALLELESIDGDLVQLVEMRYFGGLSEEQIAEAMQVSTRTVRRQWHKARLFLRETLSQV